MNIQGGHQQQQRAAKLVPTNRPMFALEQRIIANQKITTALHNHQLCPKRRRSVQFGAVQEREIEPLDLDEESKEILFYSQAELRRLKIADIKAKKRAEKQAEKNSNSISSSEGSVSASAENDPDVSTSSSASGSEEQISFRGLEHCLRNKERKNHIKEYVQRVLMIHLQQREMGYYDDYELYLVARKRSKEDCKYAQRMGSLDASEAMVLHDYGDDASMDTSSWRSGHSGSGKRSIKRWVSGKFSKLMSQSSSKGSLRRCKSQ